ncbi:MAG: glycosyltransferase family 9 protein [Candidatus Hydrogenedentes bacterium]|nr:glycosyltransferase family 9 protein [Candidatus Hydrogenedentota bacterium]
MMLHRSSHAIRTLVIHTGGIGDFLLFCPCLKRLAEEGPIELAGSDRDRLNLAVVAGIAETAHHLDDFDFASIFTTPTERFTRFASRYQRAIVWMNGPKQEIQKAFADSGVHDVRIFPGLPPNDRTRHASEYYSERLGYEKLPPLLLPFETDDYAHDVLIHAGSGAAKKNWPIDRYLALASALIDQGRSVEWIRGPAEERLNLPAAAQTLEVSSIVTLARHLTGTLLYVGNDSGVTHLAAACHCKTIAILGPTAPQVWAPLGEHVTVIANANWPTLDEVTSRIQL